MSDNKRLYDFLVTVPSLKGAAPLKDFNTFSQTYSTPEKQDKLYSFLTRVPELKGAKPLSDLNTFRSTYFKGSDMPAVGLSAPKIPEDVRKKALEEEKKQTGILDNILSFASKALAYTSPIPFIVTKIQNLYPTKEEKQKTTQGLQSPPPPPQKAKPVYDNPEDQAKADLEEITNPFNDFRKNVPSNVVSAPGVDPNTISVNDFYKVKEKLIRVGEQEKKVTELAPYSIEEKPYSQFKSNVARYKKEKDDRVAALKLEKVSRINRVYSKYPEEMGASAEPYRQKEIKQIEEEYNGKIKQVEESYDNLKNNVFANLDYQYRNAEEIKYRGDVSDPDLNKTIQKLENVKSFMTSLNSQNQVYRKRDNLVSTIKAENLGNDDEETEKEYEKYVDFPDVSPNYVTRTKLEKEKKEYIGTIESIGLNKDFKDSYVKARGEIKASLDEQREKFNNTLQEKIFSKGYKLEDLDAKSLQSVKDTEEHFKKLEKIISLYDENIDLATKRDEILKKDIGSFTDLINYKAEQDKINRLYKESPVSTFLVSLPIEFGKRIHSGTEALSFANIYLQKKLGNISKEDAELYKDILGDIPKQKTYVQKLVLDEETGMYVYKNLKDVESISIFDKKGNVKPVSEMIQNPDALLYTMVNTTAESFIVGGTGSVYRRMLYGLGDLAKKQVQKRIAGVGLIEAIEQSGIGLSRLDKAKLLSMKGIKSSATWTADVTSMLPATTMLYSPEMIQREIEKGLTVDDVATTAGLRLLAENVAENLFFDDVEFVDNLLKKGEIKTFRDLEASDAYRTLMDKVSIATVGRRLSDFEYKALFNAKNLGKILSKENMEYLIKKSIPEKLKTGAKFVAYGSEANIKESGEEVVTNGLNTIVDGWRQSEDEKYEADQEFTLENQVNTVVQTMASMLLLGSSEGYRRTKENIQERRFNVDLAAYQVALSPEVFKENLYNEFMRSQKTEKPMSEDELNLRMSEFDRIHNIYKSLGFSEEKTKENVKLQMEKLSEGKKVIDDVLKNEIEKQAEKEVRNTEFQMFREALTKSQLENAFLAAKTDKEKEEISKKIQEKIFEIAELKEQRQEQRDKLLQQRRELEQQEYSETRQRLSNVVKNIDGYISTLTTLNDVDEALQSIENYKNITDKDLKFYADIISTAIKNRQYELLSKGAKRLSPEELEQKRQLEANAFTDIENQFIEFLGIDPADISKVDGVIRYKYEGNELEFENFKQLQDFKNKKKQEKFEEMQKAEQIRLELEELSNLQDMVGDAARVYKTEDGKFTIEQPDGTITQFDNIEDLRDYIENPEEEEDLGAQIEEEEEEEVDQQQTNLELYEQELSAAYEKYRGTKKSPISKDRWLKTIEGKQVSTYLKQKYGIAQETIPVEEEKLAVTFSPLIIDLSDEKIDEINSGANIANLSAPFIEYYGYRLVNASNLIAWQARPYEEIEKVDQEKVYSSIEEISNELTKEFLFLHSPKFSVGQELKVVLKPVSESQFIKDEKDILAKNAASLINQGISQSEINADLANDEMFQEIQIFTVDGRYVGTVHSLSYIRPARVVEFSTDANNNQIPNLAPNYKALKDLRKSIIEGIKNNKTVKLTVSGKNIGHLSFRNNNEKVSLQEGFKNDKVLDSITVLKKGSTLTVGSKETINEVLQGTTAVAIPTPDGQYFALVLNKPTLQQPHVDSFINGMLLHVEYNKLIRQPSSEEVEKKLDNLNKTIDKINEQTGYDIRTVEGIKDYLHLFVNVYSKTSDYYQDQKEELKDVKFIDVDKDDKGNFRITFSNSRTFEAYDENKTQKQNFEDMGIYRIYFTDILNKTETFANYLPLLVEHLQKRNLNHNANLVSKLGKFYMPFIRKTNQESDPFAIQSESELEKYNLSSSYSNYKKYLAASSVTSILETDLGDGTFTYFQQPSISFHTDISEPQEPVEEEAPKPKRKPRQPKAKKPTEPEAKPEVTPTPAVSDKKADIERRRQEELESSKKDVTVKIETYEGIYQDTGETHVVTVRTMEDGTKIIQEKIKGEKTPMAPERIKGDQLNLPIENFTTLDKGSLTKINEQDISESELKNRINAKYDTELAALEKTKPTEKAEVIEEKEVDLTAEEKTETVEEQTTAEQILNDGTSIEESIKQLEELSKVRPTGEVSENEQKIINIYNTFTEDQKKALGSVKTIIDTYNMIGIDIDVKDFMNQLICDI